MESSVFSTGVHAKIIAQHFKGRVAFEPSDRPIGDDLVVLLFSNRSGSNLLAEYLKSGGAFRGFHESLNHDTVVKSSAELGCETFCQYFRGLHGKFSKPGGLFGVKASADQLKMLIHWGYLSAFRTCRVIRVTRDDLLAQAVSHWIADQTKQWTSRQTPRGSATYQFDGILGCLTATSKHLVMQDIVLQATGLPVVHVTYEDVVSNADATIACIYEWFGLPRNRLTLRTSIDKQADELNHEYIERFRAEFLERLGAGAE